MENLHRCAPWAFDRCFTAVQRTRAVRHDPTDVLSLERASVSMGGRVSGVGHTRLRLHPLLLLGGVQCSRAFPHPTGNCGWDPWVPMLWTWSKDQLVCVDTADAFTVARGLVVAVAVQMPAHWAGPFCDQLVRQKPVGGWSHLRLTRHPRGHRVPRVSTT